MTAITHAMGPQPHAITLDKPGACALLGITPAAFDDWRRRGVLPEPIRGTRRWSVKALRAAVEGGLDKTASDEAESALARWEREQQAKAS